MIKPLNIIIDSREQRPWSWAENDAATSVRSLVAGDYALASDCEEVKGRERLAVRFAIERKSLDDFLGTISVGWDRFQRELIRMESFPARVVIVESDFESCCFRVDDSGVIVAPKHNHPMLTPNFVARRIAELTMQNISVLFGGNSQLSAGLAFRVFKRRLDNARI